jgi:TRAP-type uncharacterized transport system substrate-binding protein
MTPPSTPRRLGGLGRAAAALAPFAVAGALAALVFLGQPFPPRSLVMTTGPEGGDYARIALRYREVLAREGVELRLLPSAGNLENLARLRDPRSGVSAGLVAGGFASGKGAPGLASLGTVLVEPLWIFCRGLSPGSPPAALRGRRVSIGPEGSGTRALALELLRQEGLDGVAEGAVALAPGAAEEALRRGEIDCAFFLGSYAHSPVVQRLLADPGFGLVGFPRADAYAAIYPAVRKVVLPMGVGDLKANLPPADVTLLAMRTSLLVREDVHPALQFLLLDAAEEVHSRRDVFRDAGKLPAPEEVDVPLSAVAREFHASGPSFLQRHLPFWLWGIASRLLLLVVPLLAVLYPLARLLPLAWDWLMRGRIVRLYGELRLLERELEGRPSGAPVDDLAEALGGLEKRVDQARVPNAYAGALYTLRMHVDLVRDRLRRR